MSIAIRGLQTRISRMDNYKVAYVQHPYSGNHLHRLIDYISYHLVPNSVYIDTEPSTPVFEIDTVAYSKPQQDDIEISRTSPASSLSRYILSLQLENLQENNKTV
ncbi:hypothetical protein KC19_5G070900 [Ceratodon purpureus]|uniref:Uncharacterized protein n=1 Tax=Ceratodon purpureus TaxID=3225 RepID=A0A8T0I069_CERPU|nr:hypothetical protein KC19_5G070900 [Ceratodon purpureus]